MSKRGQITILIILGILILVSGAILVFLRFSGEEIIQDNVPTVSAIAFDVQPVRDFVQQCAYIVAKDGVRALGDRGGYITHSFRADPLSATDGEAVAFAPQSALTIPYWFHMSADNDCIGTCPFQSARPALLSTPGTPNVEDQLTEYVEQNIQNCLGNFERLRSDGFDINPDGQLRVKTTIGEQQVYIIVNYPLTVTRAQTTHRITDYVTTLDVNLKQIFNLASDIANTQAQTRFLEQYTRNLIDGFSEIDSNALPPVTGFAIDFGPGEIWVKQDVETKLKQLLQTYIPLLQVYGSRNYRFIEAPSDTDKPGKPINDPELYEVLYNRGALIPLPNTPRTLNVKFSYLDWWDPYIDLNCKGQVCQGQSASSTYGFLFGMQQYNFAYDLSYPVLVEIENPDAFKGEGYSFKFFIEANVRNNKPMPAEFNPLKPVDIPAGTQLCDIEKRFSGDINIRVIDGQTGRLANKVYPLFTCGDESCAFNALSNGSGTIRAPLCIGGVLGIESVDAQPAYVQLDTFYGESANVTLAIEPIRYVDFSIKNYVLGKTGSKWELTTTHTITLEPDEQALIQLERIGNEYEKSFSTFASIDGDRFSKREDLSRDVPIVPGRYRVIITSFKYAHPPIKIPARTLSVSTGGFDDGKTVNIPGIEFNSTNPLPLIGTEFEWDVTKEDLDTHTGVEFKGIKFGLDNVIERDRTLDDLEILGSADNYYIAYSALLTPEWTND